MSGFDYFKKVYANYANFNGRARRKEYWYFMLFYILFVFLLSIVDFIIFREAGFGLFNSLFQLASLIPTLAVGTRRLHDINASGWWQLLYIIPIIGGIILLFFFILDSNSGDNDYGPNPKIDDL